MSPVANFAIVTVLTSGVLYLGYIALLRNEPGFRFNRVFLISGILFAHLVAIITIFPEIIPVQSASKISNITLYSAVLQPIVVTDQNNTGAESSKLPYIIYLTGAAFFLIRFSIRFISFLRLRNTAQPSITNPSVCWTKEDVGPFSYFNTMYIPESLKQSDEIVEIIKHEQVHIENKHSLDLLFIQLLRIIFWFNPFIFYFEKLLRENHEFEADKEVIKSGILPERYTHILLSQNKILKSIVLGNNFNYNILKRRLKMFYKKNSALTTIKSVTAIPAVMVIMILLAISCSRNPTDSVVPTPPPPPPPPPPIEANAPQKSEVFTIVDQMPEYPGGESARIKYLGENIKYPETAIQNNIQGTVYLSFIVEKDGSINETKIIRGISSDCDMEAFRVVNQMPRWKPGRQNGENVRVLYNLPISFRLMEDHKKGLIKTSK